MPNRDENNPDLGRRDSGDRSGSQSGSQRDRENNENNNEWLRDQVGEDHNLSGSSTYRTLPDQPEGSTDEDSGDDDAQKRQSNR
jgi:hypothetical protein